MNIAMLNTYGHLTKDTRSDIDNTQLSDACSALIDFDVTSSLRPPLASMFLYRGLRYSMHMTQLPPVRAAKNPVISKRWLPLVCSVTSLVAISSIKTRRTPAPNVTNTPVTQHISSQQ